MRRLVLAGLTMALGCLVAHTEAEEINWRPSGKKTPGVQSSRPVASQPRHAAPNKGTVRPTSFVNITTTKGAEPLFRAKFDATQGEPMPSGPSLTQPPEVPVGTKQPEIMPVPRVIEQGGDPGVVYHGDPEITPDGVVYEPGFGCECGDVIEPDWSCGLRHRKKRLWRHWFSDCVECPLPHFYASAEYLSWWVKDGGLPPLVTSSNLNLQQIAALKVGDPNFQPGAIGAVGTNVILDDEKFENPSFAGGRFTLGFGLHYDLGFEVTYFFLGETDEDFTASSNVAGSPILSVPFLNPLNNTQSAQNITVPTFLAGSVNVSQHTRLWGIEANFRKPLCCSCVSKLDLLCGFRFMELNESLQLTARNQALTQAGNTGVFQDSFGTRNRFYGGQIGLDWEKRHCRWIFGITGKVALGSVYQVADINGSTARTVNGIAQPVMNKGIYAQPSNIGRYSQDRFAVIPEIGFKIGYQITEHVSAHIGYNFLYVSDFVRPGDQIDFTVDPTQTVQRPAFLFRSRDFWAQGLNVGLECRY